VNKKSFFTNIILLSFIITFTISCVEPYNIKYNLNKSILFVDAVLTDEIEDQVVILKLSIPNKNGISSTNIGVERAKVEVLVNNTERINYTESKINLGYYYAPANFKAEIGKTYQLIIVTADGRKFQSSIEKVNPGTSIKKASQKLEIVGKIGTKEYSVFHKIYVDTDDPAGKKDFYFWKWRLFERQDICKTCNPQERYYDTPFPGVCIKDLPNFARNVVYDYQCKSGCWQIYYSSNLNIYSDEFADGKTITNKFIDDIPVYQLNRGALLEIRQQSISGAAYKYLKIIVDQSQNSGGLADTPPISLIGNIISTDGEAETVAGDFRVVDESIYNYWIDRSDTYEKEIKPRGLLDGRIANLEPTDPANTSRPPFAPCINSYFRTNIKPTGWVD
jgi:Domain of unknown function (DUF4249)